MVRLSLSSTNRGPDTDKKSVPVDVDLLASDVQALGEDIIKIAEYARTMSAEDVNEMIDYILAEHGNDLSFPRRVLEICRLYKYDQELRNDPVESLRVYEELKIEAALIMVNSPYAEVRAVADNYDDPNMPASTFRSWVIGTLFIVAGGIINWLLSIRGRSISVGSNIVQLLGFPAGKFLEKVLPTHQFTTFGYTWSLNPGKFNMKEHIVITIMANVGFDTPYITRIVMEEYLFLQQQWASNFSYQFLGALSTGFIGYGLAGLTRRFLVYPSRAVWPSNLATIALNRAFHTETNRVVDGWRISRMRWFMCCFGAMFAYYWFPGLIIQAMSCFNWMTWIAPDNVNLAAVTGSIGGLGLNPLPTWDWYQLTIATDPLINPFYSIFNGFLGTLITALIILAIWYTNTWNSAYISINDNLVRDNTGSSYSTFRVVDKHTALFNEEAYKGYSPVYLSAGMAIQFGMFFALYAATITHTILYHRREIVTGFKNLINRKSPFADSKDIHTRLMRSYREVPEYVYFGVLVASIALGAAGIGAFPTHISPAVVLYGVFLAVIFCVPCGIIMSITNVEITLEVIAELFGGLWFPGNAIAVDYSKCYGYVTTTHTLHFTQGLKLAHYMHIAPWVTFSCQMWATFVSTLVCMTILDHQMSGDCWQAQGPEKIFFCSPSVTSLAEGAPWGTPGPKKMFGPGAIYNGLLWCFPLGAVLPIPFYFLRKKFKILAYFHVPVFLFGGTIWATSNMAGVWPAVPVAYVFNYYIRRRYLGWWSKYNYITSAAFGSALAISGSVIFVVLNIYGIGIDWSGNRIHNAGVDAYPGPILKPLAYGEHFGPGPGEF